MEFLNLHFITKEIEPGLPKDFELAFEQFKLTNYNYTTSGPLSGNNLIFNENNQYIDVKGDGFLIIFDKKERY